LQPCPLVVFLPELLLFSFTLCGLTDAVVFTPSRRTILILSTLLHWCGALGISLKFPENIPEICRRLKTPWKIVAYITLVVLVTAAQARGFIHGSQKLLQATKQYETQLLPWHFMPPGFVTMMICGCILVIELAHKLVGDDGEDFELWLEFTTVLDVSISVSLAIGGAVIFRALFCEKEPLISVAVGSSELNTMMKPLI